MAGKFLVIVESPTKAKTIRRFLPKNYSVEASMGHVRDLPESASDIPAKFKKEEWAKIGVNVEEEFEPLYVVSKRKTKIVSELRKKLADADELYLATDEDREGESIAWHLVEILKPKIPTKRMVFHEITKSAIEKALTQTRKIDAQLVKAQETRRILDRLFGYTLSPLIWKKIAFGLSAGRVQSVALRVIVERERSRLKFKSASYWDLLASLKKTTEAFDAKLISLGGVRIATGKDFDENTGELPKDKKQGKDLLVLNEADARKLKDKLSTETWKVHSITEKPLTNRPAPPFITSTLQQEANRKLGLSARDAMRTAQKLYEEGLITYMRTDSPNLSQEALKAARKEVVDLYGKEYLSDEVRQYASKSKGAQEAHEAIRPAGSDFVHPKDAGLSGIELALYELIWKRTMATQMAEAKKMSLTIQIKVDTAIFSASGTRILFPGFLRAYVEGSDDPDAALEDKEILLPKLLEGDVLKLTNLSSESHETKPPSRFTEAALVQMLEKEGIGRPSTYASIIGTIVERGYVRKNASALVPTFTGFAVTQILEKNFSNLVDPKFTSKMEESLDEIADGTLEALPYLKKFYLGKEGLQNQVKVQEKAIDPDESRTVNLHSFKDI
jgi:DNA topoisomerase-1